MKNTVIIPKIFFYYAKDFGKNESAILKWISSHIKDVKKKEDLDYLSSHKFNIKYVDYDWELIALDQDEMHDLSLEETHSSSEIKIKTIRQ